MEIKGQNRERSTLATTYTTNLWTAKSRSTTPEKQDGNGKT